MSSNLENVEGFDHGTCVNCSLLTNYINGEADGAYIIDINMLLPIGPLVRTQAWVAQTGNMLFFWVTPLLRRTCDSRPSTLQNRKYLTQTQITATL